MRWSRALKEKRSLYQQRHDKMILQHDNAQPCCATGENVFGNGKFYLTRRHETLPPPIITCSDG